MQSELIKYVSAEKFYVWKWTFNVEITCVLICGKEALLDSTPARRASLAYSFVRPNWLISFAALLLAGFVHVLITKKITHYHQQRKNPLH